MLMLMPTISKIYRHAPHPRKATKDERSLLFRKVCKTSCIESIHSLLLGNMLWFAILKASRRWNLAHPIGICIDLLLQLWNWISLSVFFVYILDVVDIFRVLDNLGKNSTAWLQWSGPCILSENTGNAYRKIPWSYCSALASWKGVLPDLTGNHN